jgi:uncharacterized protein YbjT (DUF2867 family)
MKIVVLGASGNVAQAFLRQLMAGEMADIELTLFVRNKRRLPREQSERFNVVVGDARELNDLKSALVGADMVLSFIGNGPLDELAKVLVNAMADDDLDLERVVWLSAAGIYNETVGQEGMYPKMMPGYFGMHRHAAEIIADSGQPYTIIRPVQFNGRGKSVPVISIGSETVYGQNVSRETVASVYVDIVRNGAYRNQSVGVGE